MFFLFKKAPAPVLSAEEQADQDFHRLMWKLGAFEVSEIELKSLRWFKHRILLYPMSKRWETAKLEAFVVTNLQGTTYKGKHYFYGITIVYAQDLPNAAPQGISFPGARTYAAVMERLRLMHDNYQQVVRLQAYAAELAQQPTPAAVPA